MKGATARRPADVLLVAGELSGDRIAGGVARALAPLGVACAGMGGASCRAAGVRPIASLEGLSAMGLTEIAGHAPAVVRAFVRLAKHVALAPLRAAVLVDYTEFNRRLAARLRARGVPVLWCVAPQVWAWRPGRTPGLARLMSRLAVILPFEAPLWRAAGVETEYVGHPALDEPFSPKEIARAKLGITPAEIAIGLLPGSRSHEVRRLAPSMLAAALGFRARFGGTARLLVAPSLDAPTAAWLQALAAARGVPAVGVSPARGAAEWLAAFDATLTASGTATLESALAGAPPVILSRASIVTAAVARALLRTPHLGLPNVLLGERVYPELVQGAVSAASVARAVEEVLSRSDDYRARRAELERLLGRGRAARRATDRMAEMIHDWLGVGPAPSADSFVDRASSLGRTAS